MTTCSARIDHRLQRRLLFVSYICVVLRLNVLARTYAATAFRGVGHPLKRSVGGEVPTPRYRSRLCSTPMPVGINFEIRAKKQYAPETHGCLDGIMFNTMRNGLSRCFVFPKSQFCSHPECLNRSQFVTFLPVEIADERCY